MRSLVSFFKRLFQSEEGRARRCRAAGTHRPVLVDLGRDKICPNCGAH